MSCNRCHHLNRRWLQSQNDKHYTHACTDCVLEVYIDVYPRNCVSCQDVQHMSTDTTQVICVQLAEHVVELILVGLSLLELLDMLFRSHPIMETLVWATMDIFLTFNCLSYNMFLFVGHATHFRYAVRPHKPCVGYVVDVGLHPP